MTPDRTAARPGFSLVEMLGTITVLTILLGLAAGMIRTLLRLDQSGRDAMVVAADTTRLSHDFRNDAHRSTSLAAPVPGEDRLTWTLSDDSEVSYLIRPHDLLREVRQGGKIQHRELYRRPPRSSVWFDAVAGPGPPLVSIVLRREPGSAAPDDRIDAEFGRINRLIARHP